MEATLRPTFRAVLVDSHIADVAIAILLLWSLDSGIRFLGRLLFHAAYFLFSVVAIWGIPSDFGTFTLADRLMLDPILTDLFSTVIRLGAAWLVSRWVYGVGPFRSLTQCRTRLARRDYA